MVVRGEGVTNSKLGENLIKNKFAHATQCTFPYEAGLERGGGGGVDLQAKRRGAA